MTILEFKPKAKEPRIIHFGAKWVCNCGSDSFRLVQEEGDPDWCAECLGCNELHIPPSIFHTHT